MAAADYYLWPIPPVFEYTSTCATYDKGTTDPPNECFCSQLGRWTCRTWKWRTKWKFKPAFTL